MQGLCTYLNITQSVKISWESSFTKTNLREENWFLKSLMQYSLDIFKTLLYMIKLKII